MRHASQRGNSIRGPVSVDMQCFSDVIDRAVAHPAGNQTLPQNLGCPIGQFFQIFDIAERFAEILKGAQPNLLVHKDLEVVL